MRVGSSADLATLMEVLPVECPSDLSQEQGWSGLDSRPAGMIHKDGPRVRQHSQAGILSPVEKNLAGRGFTLGRKRADFVAERQEGAQDSAAGSSRGCSTSAAHGSACLLLFSAQFAHSWPAALLLLLLQPRQQSPHGRSYFARLFPILLDSFAPLQTRSLLLPVLLAVVVEGIWSSFRVSSPSCVL